MNFQVLSVLSCEKVLEFTGLHVFFPCERSVSPLDSFFRHFWVLLQKKHSQKSEDFWSPKMDGLCRWLKGWLILLLRGPRESSRDSMLISVRYLRRSRSTKEKGREWPSHARHEGCREKIRWNVLYIIIYIYMEHLLCISVDRLDFILSLPHAGIGMIHSGVIMYMLICMHIWICIYTHIIVSRGLPSTPPWYELLKICLQRFTKHWALHNSEIFLP